MGLPSCGSGDYLDGGVSTQVVQKSTDFSIGARRSLNDFLAMNSVDGPNERGVSIFINSKQMVESMDIFATAGDRPRL